MYHHSVLGLASAHFVEIVMLDHVAFAEHGDAP